MTCFPQLGLEAKTGLEVLRDFMESDGTGRAVVHTLIAAIAASSRAVAVIANAL